MTTSAEELFNPPTLLQRILAFLTKAQVSFNTEPRFLCPLPKCRLPIPLNQLSDHYATHPRCPHCQLRQLNSRTLQFDHCCPRKRPLQLLTLPSQEMLTYRCSVCESSNKPAKPFRSRQHLAEHYRLIHHFKELPVELPADNQRTARKRARIRVSCNSEASIQPTPPPVPPEEQSIPKLETTLVLIEHCALFHCSNRPLTEDEQKAAHLLLTARPSKKWPSAVPSPSSATTHSNLI